MTSRSPHPESHKSQRSPWLRASVLGVNDGIISTSGLMMGVLGASSNTTAILTAGAAGLVAGAISMALGEYVSVSSQKDAEKADIAIEKRSIAANPEEEMQELAAIYESRGLDKVLAKQVAQQLHAHNAVDAHARDELNIDPRTLAKPVQAAIASTVSFSIGAFVPILAALVSGNTKSGLLIVLFSLVALALSGSVGASIGGGRRIVASLRVLFGGGIAMAVTYAIGLLIGHAV